MVYSDSMEQTVTDCDGAYGILKLHGIVFVACRRPERNDCAGFTESSYVVPTKYR